MATRSLWKPPALQLLIALIILASGCSQATGISPASSVQPNSLPPQWTSTALQALPSPVEPHALAGEPSTPLTPSPATATQMPPSSTPLPFHVAPAMDARNAYESSSVRLLNQIMEPEHTLTLTDNEPLLWISGWCAISQEILDQNLTVMETRLYVDGYFINPKYYWSRDYGSDDPQNPSFCRGVYILIDSWREGNTCLEAQYAILEPLFDGWSEYPRGPISSYFCVTLELE
jgi:hypothetical protein